MQLWNDYEGKTIAERYSIGSLLWPEGRSAFFALPESVESPSIIRLTESVNDEHEMLERWRLVAEVKQENLVSIRQFGETSFEGKPLMYAVMEATDANLGDLLKERPLTYAEAMQVATSVAAALSALHEKGLIHGHIEASNILAAGETVKLRTDCVRECVADPGKTVAGECQDLIQRDVQDFARLLLRALTLEKRISNKTKLPAPFDRVIPNAMSGAWGLPEITAALAAPLGTPKGGTAPLVPESVMRPAGAGPVARAAGSSAEPRAALAEEGEQTPVDPALAYRRQAEERDVPARSSMALWAGGGGALLLLVLLCWYLLRSKPAPVQQTPARQTAAQETVVVRPAAAAPPASSQARTGVPVPEGNAVAGPAASASGHPAVAPMQAGWYVVAYTYNHEAQAWKRAGEILKRHPSLHALVVAPGGHAPFLVAIGGPMSRREAETVRSQARRSGLPRDTFVRNYAGS